MTQDVMNVVRITNGGGLPIGLPAHAPTATAMILESFGSRCLRLTELKIRTTCLTDLSLIVNPSNPSPTIRGKEAKILAVDEWWEQKDMEIKPGKVWWTNYETFN